MAKSVQGKQKEGLRPRGFSIPSVEDIRQANKVSAGKRPTLFKSTTSAAASSSQDIKEKQQTSTAAVERTKDRPVSDTAPVQENLATFPRPGSHGANRHLSRNCLKEKSKTVPSHSEHTESKSATTGVANQLDNDVQSRGGGGSVQLLESAPESATVSIAEASSTAGTIVTAATHHQPHAIITNPIQRKNPVMKHIHNVPWELGDIVPDFVLGKTTCALFLSVRYHSLHPNYIHTRLKELGKQYQLRILLVLVDTSECQKILQDLAKIAILADLTLILAWSYEEAGRYLETYKAYENKPPDLLMERVESDFTSRVTESLTTVKKVNKTDAATLLNTFKTMEKIISASKEELTLCPGLGPQKAQRLHDLFHEPFIRQKKPKLN